MNNQEVTLLTPGPTPIHPRAMAAFYWPMRSHMDPDIFAYNDQIVLNLHKLYKTAPGAFTSLLSGTGSLGMEVGFANLLEPGDKVLIVTNGVFGSRMIEMSKRIGAEVIPVEFPASQAVDIEKVRLIAHQTMPKVIAIVHGETSTGVLNPVPEIAQIAAEVDALYSVDAVTTVGMLEFDMAAWGIDYAYTGSQKCLSAPPGLAPVAFSQRAMETIATRKTPVMTWYSDAVGMQAYWQPGERKYHHTVPIHLHWATGEAIKLALEEGIPKRTRRVKQVGNAALRALETAGFSALIPEAYRLPTVMAVKLPEGLDDAKVRHQLRHDYFISVTGGLGETAGKIWRLGLMGENARAEHYARLMEALAIILNQPQLPHMFEEALAVA
jgi:alanine-glyoxylate transaminase/serine-glyoxylate transaminase/serine-pyruvate transaminase